MRLGNTILRWVLAPFGATAGLVLGFLFPALISFVFFGRAGMTNIASAPGFVTLTLAVMCSLFAWAWVGSSIVPGHHRRMALGVFSAPVVLLGMVFLLALFYGPLTTRGVVPTVIGTLLAWIAIAALGVMRRHLSLAKERRRAIEHIAEVFSDQPGQVLKQ